MSQSRRLSFSVNLLGFLEAQVRNLKGYRTLISELIQNTDDAPGAGEGDPGPTEMEFQVTPDALHVRNNGSFRDVDFERLREIASGGKRQEENTTGAFGIGFIAVYQITDSPELTSAGRHWVFRPESREIVEGVDDSCTGTHFRFPWAMNPDTQIRRELRLEAVRSTGPDEFLQELDEVLPQAVLFLKKVETVRYGSPAAPRKVTRILDTDQDQVLIQNGGLQHWQLLRGEFSDEERRLRSEYPDKIEDKRKCKVVLALPLDDELAEEWEGSFFATLPTQQPTLLPFHIQADFFPASDRKNLLWEGDFQGEWNRAAVRAAARTLADNLSHLPRLLGRPARVCAFLRRLQEISQQASRQPRPGCLPVLGTFWKYAGPVARDCEIVRTSNKGWQVPGAVILLTEDDEPFRPVAEQLGLAVAVGEIRSFQNLLTSLGAKALLFQRLAEALTAATPNPVAEQDAPEWLRSLPLHTLLAEEIGRLLDRHRQQHAEAEAKFKTCVLARGTDGRFYPPHLLLCGDTKTISVFGPPVLQRPFMDPGTPSPIRRLVPQFDAKRAVDELARVPGEVLAELWATRPDAIRGVIGWFADHAEQLRGDKPLRAQLRQLHLWPSSSGLHPLSALVMPGGFRDDLQLAQVLEDGVVQAHGDFLRHVMDARLLTIRDYVTLHVPGAFQKNVVPENARKLVDLLADRLGEFRDSEDARRALSSRPLVECADGQFLPSHTVYFAEADVTRLLGRPVPTALVRREAVAGLYDWLGVARRPRVRDVIDRVIQLTARAPSPQSRVAIQRVLAHLINRWPEEGAGSWNALRELAWLPAQGDDSAWYRPELLHATYSRHLFSQSGALFLDLDPTLQNQRAGSEVLGYLGVLTGEPPVGLVVTHLLACAGAGSAVNPEVYKFLDRHSAAGDVGRLCRKPCLLQNDGTYADPQSVFRKDPKLGRFARVLTGEAARYHSLLDRLGVADTPGPDAAIRVLEAMETEFGKAKLPVVDPDDQEVLWYCWKILADAAEPQLRALQDRRCVLNGQRLLCPPEHLLINDRPGLAPGFAQYLEHNLIARREDTWRVLHRGGVRLLSDVLESVLMSVDNPRPAEWLTLRVRDRWAALARVLEGLPVDDRGRRPLDRLLHLRLLEADEIRVQKNLLWPRRISLSPELVPAHPVPEAEQLYLTPLSSGSQYWPQVARAMLAAIMPEGDVSRLAAAVMGVLSVDSADDARALLDALGVAPLDVKDISGVSSGTAFETAQSACTSRPEEAAGGIEPIFEDTVPAGPAEKLPMEAKDLPLPVPSRGSREERTGIASGTHSHVHPNHRSEEFAPTGRPGIRTAVDSSDSHHEEEEGEEHEHRKTQDKDIDSDGNGTRQGRRGELPARQPRATPPGQQERLVSYVVHKTAADPSDEDSEPLEEDDWHGLGQHGVERVAAEERRLHPDWEVRVMGRNHPGYDLEVRKEGILIRYIEVKSLRDVWGDRGVGMTSTQFKFAQKEKERYWLYIVERVEDLYSPITRIQNPACRVSRFQFDAGWRSADY